MSVPVRLRTQTAPAASRRKSRPNSPRPIDQRKAGKQREEFGLGRAAGLNAADTLDQCIDHKRWRSTAVANQVREEA